MLRVLFGSEQQKSVAVARSHRRIDVPGKNKVRPQIEVQPKRSRWWFDDPTFDIFAVVVGKRIKLKSDLFADECRTAIREHQKAGADVSVLKSKLKGQGL